MKTCEQCGVTLVARATEAKATFMRRRFCSHACSNRGQTHDHPPIFCQQCGEEIKRAPRTSSWPAHQARISCSRECASAAARGSLRSNRVERIGLPDSFWLRCEWSDAGCLEWQGYRDPGGYGRTAVGGRHILVHRLAYAALVGEIPEGLQIDHLCNNPSCVFPLHLEVVTHAENQRRRWARKAVA